MLSIKKSVILITEEGNKEQQAEQKKDEEMTNNVVNLTPNKLYKAYLKSVSEKKWRELMADPNIDGCCTCCGNPIGIEQHRDIMWLNDHCVLCETCKEDPTIINYLRNIS